MILSADSNIGFFIFGWLFFTSIIALIRNVLSCEKRSASSVIAASLTGISSFLGMLYYMASGCASNVLYCITVSVLWSLTIAIDIVLFIKSIKEDVNDMLNHENKDLN